MGRFLESSHCPERAKMAIGPRVIHTVLYCALLSRGHVQLFVTPWTAPCQAPLSMGILQARILEWVAMPFSRGSSRPRDWTRLSCVAGRFFTSWAVREAQGGAHRYLNQGGKLPPDGAKTAARTRVNLNCAASTPELLADCRVFCFFYFEFMSPHFIQFCFSDLICWVVAGLYWSLVWLAG